ncbi:MAG: PKD domain-containing protein, partial [Phaeodactylibacter sp.]|nr:PKD domain-containing protein [Phaeodactylibacter sp.]
PSFNYLVAGDTVSFTNNTPNGDSYLWDFGDGQFSTENNPQHSYSAAGVFTICLSATNSCGTNNYCQVLDTDAAGVVGTCSPEMLLDTLPGFQALYASYLGGRGLRTVPLSDGGILTILDLNGDSPLYYGDMGLMKTDGDGRLIWAKAFTDSLLAQITDIVELGNGHFLFCGYSENVGVGNSDGLLGELSPCGEVIWLKTYGGPQRERLYSLALGDPGEVIAVGRTNSYGSGLDDVFLLKTDLSGNVIWAKAYGGSNDDDARSVVTGHQSATAKFLIAGNTESFPAGFAEAHILFFSVDTDGNVGVVKALGDAYDEGSLYAEEIREYFLPAFNSYFYTICGLTYDDDIFIGGLTNQAQNGFITTVNLNGLPSYARMITGTRMEGLTTIPGQGYAACGQSRILRFNNDLSSRWIKSYGGMNVEGLYGISLADNGSFYATGYTNSFPNYSGYLLELDTAGISGCYEATDSLGNIDVEQWVDAHSPTGSQFQVTTLTGILSVTQPSLAFNDLILQQKYLCPTSLCEIELNLVDTLIHACQGSQIQHNAIVEYAESLRWYLNDSLIGGGGSISYTYDSAGTYILKALADNSICTKMDSLTIVIDPLDTDITVQANLTQASDLAAANGSIDLTILNNPGPFQYQWTTGDTTQDLSGLNAGPYQLTLTYNTSCTLNSQYQLYEYPNLPLDSLPLFNLNYPAAGLDDTQVKRQDATSYLLVGHANNALSFMKLDLLGKVIWDRTYFINLVPKSLHILPDGSFYIIDDEALLLAADPEGNIKWIRSFPNDVTLRDVAAFSNGEAVLTGFIDSSPATNGQKFAWFARLDLQGNILWHNSIGNSSDPNFGECVRVRDDKAYILGSTDSWGDAFSWLSDLLMIRVSADGSIDWVRTTGIREGGDRREDIPLDFEILSNGHFVVLTEHSTY